MPPMDHGDVSTVRCTYIEIPQAKSTLGVVLSKPSWMWGCEMGANDKGVVGGNEAVHSVMSSELGSEERLLGMDLLRLALERGPTAHEVRTCRYSARPALSAAWTNSDVHPLGGPSVHRAPRSAWARRRLRGG